MHFTEMSQEQAERIVKELVKNGQARRKDSEQMVEELMSRGREAGGSAVASMQTELSKQLGRFAGRLDEVEARLEDIAKKQSKDSGSGANGGDLGFANPAAYVPEFSQAMVKLKKGEMTDTPVQSQFGYHIILLVETRESAPFQAPSIPPPPLFPAAASKNPAPTDSYPPHPPASHSTQNSSVSAPDTHTPPSPPPPPTPPPAPPKNSSQTPCSPHTPPGPASATPPPDCSHSKSHLAAAASAAAHDTTPPPH
jgi:polyhydroxyalkanoate synthesis regulator phasin